jgi:transcriptional regulator with XRE-family HTH domain
MSKIDDYRAFLKSVTSSLGYWKSYSLLQFTLSITRMMQSEKISGRKLAALLGMSPTQVSKVLSGKENVTIETMAKFAMALDAVVYIHVAKRDVQVQWSELLPLDTSARPATDSTVIDFATAKAYPRRAKNQGMQEKRISMSARFEEEAYG